MVVTTVIVAAFLSCAMPRIDAECLLPSQSSTLQALTNAAGSDSSSTHLTPPDSTSELPQLLCTYTTHSVPFGHMAATAIPALGQGNMAVPLSSSITVTMRTRSFGLARLPRLFGQSFWKEMRI
jgi:hypothetical protein